MLKIKEGAVINKKEVNSLLPLKNETFKNLTFTDCEISGHHLKNVTFENCDFVNSFFINCEFINVIFSNCHFENDQYFPHFLNVDLKETSFQDTRLIKSQLIGKSLFIPDWTITSNLQK